MNRPARVLVTLTVLALIGAGVAVAISWWVDGTVGPLIIRDRCTADVDGHQVVLDPQQASHAATIAAVAERRGLPARAVTIALAAAYQESDLYNLDYGDRDSLGLFQQRPSQGWGTPEEVMNPVHAANVFYDALVDVPDYRQLEITEAAQAVQRSAYPGAYADHETDARVLASALSGYSEAALTCSFRPGDQAEQPEERDGLTARARTVRDELNATFPSLEIGGYQAGGIDSGHIEGSAHYDGRALDIFFRPHDDPARNRAGWVVAHWLVVNAHRLGVATVIYDERLWSARRSTEGWRPYEHPSGDTQNPTLRHLDHVHIAVARGD